MLLDNKRFAKIRDEIDKDFYDSPFWKRYRREQKRDTIIGIVVAVLLLALLFLYVYAVSYAYHNAETQEEKDKILHDVEKGIWMGTGRGVIIYDERNQQQ